MFFLCLYSSLKALFCISENINGDKKTAIKNTYRRTLYSPTDFFYFYLFFLQVLWYKMQLWCLSIGYKMLFKTILDDLEWQKFFATQLWWATFKINFLVTITGKIHISFWKVTSNPATFNNTVKINTALVLYYGITTFIWTTWLVC